MNRSAAAPWTIRLRAALLGTLALGLACVVVVATIALLTPAPGRPTPSFAALVVRAATATSLLAGGRLCLVALAVAGQVWRDATTAAASAPAASALRRFLLAACGASVVLLGATTPSLADGAPAAPSLAGLPLPDRAEGAHPTGSARAVTVIVRPGDSLWTLAQRQLGARASTTEVASYWRRMLHANRSTLGPDPDLIRPGQALELPTHHSRSER